MIDLNTNIIEAGIRLLYCYNNGGMTYIYDCFELTKSILLKHEADLFLLGLKLIVDGQDSPLIAHLLELRILQMEDEVELSQKEKISLIMIKQFIYWIQNADISSIHVYLKFCKDSEHLWNIKHWKGINNVTWKLSVSDYLKLSKEEIKKIIMANS